MTIERHVGQHARQRITTILFVLTLWGFGSAQVVWGQPAIRLPESVRATNAHPVMEVAPLNPNNRAAIQGVAERIDAAVLAHLLDRQARPNPTSSDEVFVRRIYLDLAGRIPTDDEVRTFLSSEGPDKRLDLIDTLLESPDYVSNFYNFWADTLRLTERPEPNLVSEPYLAYIKNVIRTNKPYDQWVFEMLTADGKVWQNPAAGFQLRDNAMPLPYVDNTVRVFLGTQIGCAQCHDHPFDQWTQLQFYQLAAYTAGTQTRVRRSPGATKNPAQQLIAQARANLPRKEVNPFQRLVRANTYAVSERKTRLKLPHDYAYSNGEPNQPVDPAVLWGDVPDQYHNESPRVQFAAWLTSPQNSQFLKTIANRLWHRMTGIGVVEPIDDFRDDHKPFSEPLLEVLSTAVLDNEFDLRETIRAIAYSQAYQRTAMVYDPLQRESLAFQGPALRRMSAEQAWDSILQMTVDNPWPFQRPEAAEFESLMELSLEESEYEQVLEQAKAFQQSQYVNLNRRGLMQQHGYRGMLLGKASELPTPLPASHFIRQFGQGDRDTINGNNTEATVPQVLTMFNGPITHVMMEPGARMHRLLDECSNVNQAVDLIFFSVLARFPDEEERQIAVEEIQNHPKRRLGQANVLWALLNTREFLFVQ